MYLYTNTYTRMQIYTSIFICIWRDGRLCDVLLSPARVCVQHTSVRLSSAMGDLIATRSTNCARGKGDRHIPGCFPGSVRVGQAPSPGVMRTATMTQVGHTLAKCEGSGRILRPSNRRLGQVLRFHVGNRFSALGLFVCMLMLFLLCYVICVLLQRASLPFCHLSGVRMRRALFM